jgi:hypothetical protein
MNQNWLHHNFDQLQVKNQTKEKIKLIIKSTPHQVTGLRTLLKQFAVLLMVCKFINILVNLKAYDKIKINY